jgi:hypothetical protein
VRETPAGIVKVLFLAIGIGFAVAILATVIEASVSAYGVGI